MLSRVHCYPKLVVFYQTYNRYYFIEANYFYVKSYIDVSHIQSPHFSLCLEWCNIIRTIDAIIANFPECGCDLITLFSINHCVICFFVVTFNAKRKCIPTYVPIQKYPSIHFLCYFNCFQWNFCT